MLRRSILQLGACLTVSTLAGAAPDHAEIAVLVPEIAEPYRSIFAQIVAGIESATQAHVLVITVGAAASPAQLEAQLQAAGVRAVVALGRNGLKAVAGLSAPLAVIVGGVLAAPGMDGISLAPDPALLLAKLKALQPATRRVLVVEDPAHSEWLMGLARAAAKAQALELVEMPARDLGAAAKAYEQLLADATGPRDAVWLPPDPTTVEESTLVPLVLKTSWNRRVTVFSSLYPHVKLGALFAVAPDNRALGQALGAHVLKRLAGEPAGTLRPLREVRAGVNLRAATHLGIALDAEQLRGFHDVFQEF